MSNKFMLNAFAKLNKKAARRFFISPSLEKARRFRGEKHVVVDVVLKTAGVKFEQNILALFQN